MSHAQLVRVRVEGTERTISFSPDHINTLATARQIGAQLCTLIEQQGDDHDPVEKLVLDLQEIAWISSTALNELIDVNRQARSRGVKLVLTNVQEPVYDVFVLTRLERMFELSATMENA